MIDLEDLKNWLILEEAANLLGVSILTVRRLVVKQQLETVKIERQYKVSREELQRYVNSQVKARGEQ